LKIKRDKYKKNGNYSADLSALIPSI